MKPNRYFAGVHAIDITPVPGCRLAGHLARKEPAKKIHDPLMAKALVIGCGRKWVALIATDLVRLPRPMIKSLRAKARRLFGLNPDQLLLTSTHTHTGPFTAIDPRIHDGLPPPGYPKRLENAILDAIALARKTARLVKLSLGHDHINIGAVNRRLPGPDGIAIMAPNFDGPIDDGVPVLRVQNADGSLLAALLIYACHPTTLSTDIAEISGDYPGAAQRALEKLNPGAIALFMTGCCGDVRPAIIKDNKFIGGSFADSERMGKKLAAKADKILKTAKPLEPSPIFSRLVNVRLPLVKRLIPKNPRHLSLLCKGYMAKHPEWSAAILDWKHDLSEQLRSKQPLPTHIAFDVQCIRIGSATFLGISGEVFARLGLEMKQAHGEHFALVCLANGSFAYLPTAEALTEDGYERINFIFRGLPAPLDPCAPARVLRAVKRAMNQ